MDAIVKKPAAGEKQLAISRPRMAVATVEITGTAPLMIAKFSQKAIGKIEATQRAGGQAKSKKNREARNFEADMEHARHVSVDGWDGVAASAFRNACIDACRAAGFVMTKAKLAVFTLADGYDRDDGTPLVRINSELGYEQSIMAVRNSSGVMDLRSRPLWREWSMKVQLRFDEDILSVDDITNLMLRVGLQVGIGEGRPFGREGTGMGFGLFSITSVSYAGEAR